MLESKKIAQILWKVVLPIESYKELGVFPGDF